jgi:hypothetical protein
MSWMNLKAGLAIAMSGAICGTAAAQEFVNPDFETGDLSGWTVRETPDGMTWPPMVEQYEIQGPGTGFSYAARFSVGQVERTTGQPEGIDLIQELELTEGVEYTISFYWSAFRFSGGTNSEGGVFSVVIDGDLYGTQNAGSTSPTMPHFGFIEVNYTATRTGPHTVGARIARPFTASAAIGQILVQYVDDFNIRGGGVAPCYPDCDNNGTLDFFDFLCFQNAFLAQDPYADCDQNGVFDFFDFLCFQNEFLAGCP